MMYFDGTRRRQLHITVATLTFDVRTDITMSRMACRLVVLDVRPFGNQATFRLRVTSPYRRDTRRQSFVSPSWAADTKRQRNQRCKVAGVMGRFVYLYCSLA